MRASVLIFCFLLLSLGSYGQSKKEKKKAKALQEFQQMDTLINSKNFEFNADWATTSGGRRINLINNPNWLKVMNDSVDLFLPYFGTGQVPSNSLTDGGLTYQGIPESYELDINEKKMSYMIRIRTKGAGEQLDLTLQVYGNGSAYINVSSTVRTFIKYQGSLGKIKNPK